MADSATSFQELCAKHGTTVGPHVALLLTWVVTCDDDVTAEERDLLTSMWPPALRVDSDLLIAIALRRRPSDLATACSAVDRSLDREAKLRLVGLMMHLAVVDNRMAFAEIQVIRLMADLFGLGSPILDSMFREITGKPFPEPGDLSSKPWWVERESQHRDDRREDGARTSPPPQGQRRRWALTVLGLDDGASPEQIRQAYRQKCLVHHPDKFTALGPEAVGAANVILTKINEAYEVLSRS